jgi:hypothetical protein
LKPKNPEGLGQSYQFVGKTKMRCSKCVLPACTPNIAFDKKGICNYCHSYKEFKFKGESALIRLLDAHRRPDSQYDCLVGISGGRDSSYTLLKLVKDYQMKVLAASYENPFADPQAKQNIENMIKILNVGVIQFKLKNNIHERTFRNNMLAWLRRPSAALVGTVCIACKTFCWNILRIARKHDIHCIIFGGNPYEYTSFKKELLHVSKEEGHELAFIKYVYGFLREAATNLRYFHPVCIPTMVKGYLFGNQYAIGPRLLARDIVWTDLFHYIRWDEGEVLSRIQSELDWDYPHNLDSSWRFDCRVGHLKDFMYMKTLKMTERDDFYAKMVREGLMTREDALRRIHRENTLHWDEIDRLLSEVEIEEVSRLCETSSHP